MNPTQPPPPSSWHLLGAGAIGCLWACQLRLIGHPVSLIVRNTEGLARFTKPLSLEGLSRADSLTLEAQTADTDQPIRQLLVCTKSYDSVEAIRSIHPRLAEGACVVLLQNGMGQQQQVRELFDRTSGSNRIRLYAATTTEGAYLENHNNRLRLVHAGRGESWYGPINSAAEQQGPLPLAELFELPIGGDYDPQISARLWQKLAINAAINGLTALHRCRNGELASNPDYHCQMAQLCAEIEQLGQPLFNQPLIERATAVAQATADNYSSMLQDVRNHRRTEIDFINGFICHEAERIGLTLPYNRQLLEAIHRLGPASTNSINQEN